MLILVTGTAGYLGSIVSSLLLERGHRVRGLDNLMHGGRAVLPLVGHERFQFLADDVRDASAVQRAVSGVDAVVHLAAVVGDPACARDAELALEVNEHASAALIAAANAAGVQRFIFASTCSNYGRIADTSLPADETHPLGPLSLYARTKVAVEELLLSADHHPGLAPTVLRFATLYGASPRMRFDLTVNQFVMEMLVRRKVTVFGEQFWRPYVHVRDAASAIARVLDAPAAQVAGQVFNVGSTSENYRKLDLVDLVLERVPGAEVQFVHVADDPRDYKVSFERIRTALGYVPSRSVRDGITEVADLLERGIMSDVNADEHYNDRHVSRTIAGRKDEVACAQ